MRWSGWVEGVFRPLAVGAMMGCMAVSLAELAHLFFPAWNATFLIVGSGLAALEANYSYRLIRANPSFGGDVLKFRLVELATLFIALKIGSYLGDPWSEVWADIRTWPNDPLAILDVESLVAFVMALVSWQAATGTARDLELLAEPVTEADLRAWAGQDRLSAIESLWQRFLWGGVLLLALAGLTRLGLAELLNMNRPFVPGLVLNVLVYFSLGVIMLGQAHFAVSYARWQADQFQVAAELPGRWARCSLAFLSLAALIAFLWPTRYALGLFEVIEWMAGALYSIVWFLSMLLFLACAIPISWFLWLLSRLGGAETAPEFTPEPLALPPQREPPPVPGWYDLLQSVFFWVAVLGIVYVVVRAYLQDHPGLVQAVRTLDPIRTARRWWMALWERLGRWSRAAGARLPRRRSAPWKRAGVLPVGQPAFRFFHLGARSPREQVLYYYLSIVRRAGRLGLARRPAQTPYEYDAELGASLPQAQPDLAGLTQAFVEARYGRRAVEPAGARRAHALWRRVRAALQALRRP